LLQNPIISYLIFVLYCSLFIKWINMLQLKQVVLL
jgi:hypothetical protein